MIRTVIISVTMLKISEMIAVILRLLNLFFLSISALRKIIANRTGNIYLFGR